MTLVYVNLAACSIAGTIYALSALRSAQRHRPISAIVNILVALASISFAAGYIAIVVDPTGNPTLTSSVFRPILPFLLLLPAVARYLELRHDERRDALGRLLAERLR